MKSHPDGGWIEDGEFGRIWVSLVHPTSADPSDDDRIWFEKNESQRQYIRPVSPGDWCIAPLDERPADLWVLVTQLEPGLRTRVPISLREQYEMAG